MTSLALATEGEDLDEPRPAWLIVRPWQVMALSASTFGIYLLYWQLEQWSALRNASLRVPWSYRYGFGLRLGVSTNFTTLERGAAPDRTDWAERSAFAPVWGLLAVAHEWRVSLGFTYRLSLGVRALASAKDLRDAQASHCHAVRTEIEPLELALDRPDLDHTRFPVLPWASFDLGFAL